MRLGAVHAFLSVDPDTDEEGIVAFQTDAGVWVPLVCGDEARVKAMRPIAVTIGQQTRQTIRLVRFEQRTDVEEIMP